MGKLKKRQAHKAQGLIDLLLLLQVEAEKLVRRVAEKTEQSSRELKGQIGEIVEEIREKGVYSVASEKGGEFRKLADQVIVRAKEIQFGAFNRDRLIREAKRNLEEAVVKIQSQLFSVLSIPSLRDVNRLSSRITTLEKRMGKIKRKAA
ncbi:MAG: hypothetical protein HYY44_06675 [Deltaproteobacteria bacterium]|nr:hypothetical protein [Deltaproteobacteria bacterium]MBI4374479.1 hypothetical protein [Deltaproteobacteria bacterium]